MTYFLLTLGENATVDPLDAWAYQRVVLAERFGWRLDYIDSLSQADVGSVIGVLRGIEKVKAEKQP